MKAKKEDDLDKDGGDDDDGQPSRQSPSKQRIRRETVEACNYFFLPSTIEVSPAQGWDLTGRGCIHEKRTPSPPKA